MRSVPNMLTFARIALAAPLLFLPVMSGAFIAVYLLCGLTDMLDGWLARRLQAESMFGSRLDSMADFAVIAVLLWRFFPVVAPDARVLCWVGAIAGLRFAAALTAKCRFGKLGFLHTLGNKLTGLLLFMYPLTLAFTRSKAVLYTLLALATLSAAEELAIELTATRWEPDRRSIFL